MAMASKIDIESKKSEFMKFVEEASRKLNLDKVPLVKFWEKKCPDYKGKDNTHIHVELGMICVNLKSLKKMDEAKIRETAANEADHLIHPDFRRDIPKIPMAEIKAPEQPNIFDWKKSIPLFVFLFIIASILIAMNFMTGPEELTVKDLDIEYPSAVNVTVAAPMEKIPLKLSDISGIRNNYMDSVYTFSELVGFIEVYGNQEMYQSYLSDGQNNSLRLALYTNEARELVKSSSIGQVYRLNGTFSGTATNPYFIVDSIMPIENKT